MGSILLILLAALVMLLFGGDKNRRHHTLFGDKYSHYQLPYSYEQERRDWLWHEEEYRRKRHQEKNSDGSGCLMFLLAFLALIGYWVTSVG